MKDLSESAENSNKPLPDEVARYVKAALKKNCTTDCTSEDRGMLWVISVPYGGRGLDLVFTFYYSKAIGNKLVMQPSSGPTEDGSPCTALLLNVPSSLLNFARKVAKQLGVVYQPVWCVSPPHLEDVRPARLN